MSNLSILTDEMNLKLYDVECLAKCLANSFETSLYTNENCSYLLPVAKIMTGKCYALSRLYKKIDYEIFKQLQVKHF